MTVKTKTSHSSLKSLVKGLVLGLTIHSNYDSIKPKDIAFEGRHPDLNQNPKQFHLGSFSSCEVNRLQELQTLDILQDLVDPDPGDHIWRCIAVTKHKVRDLDHDDIHIKVKAVWANPDPD
jgi:hypothetical protein